jgi:hypothetical protein
LAAAAQGDSAAIRAMLAGEPDFIVFNELARSVL